MIEIKKTIAGIVVIYYYIIVKQKSKIIGNSLKKW
jgi:hypothetical protein